MKTSLRKYKNNCKGTKLSDGKTVGGFGRFHIYQSYIYHIWSHDLWSKAWNVRGAA